MFHRHDWGAWKRWNGLIYSSDGKDIRGLETWNRRDCLTCPEYQQQLPVFISTSELGYWASATEAGQVRKVVTA